ncbi:MAG: patatin-like phospholipase family protein [Candidatus Oleimicrobiaceae bacterium]
MLRSGILSTFLLTFLCFRQLAANERPHPTVGLALSAGGARGLAHIGVLMALEEKGIPVDMVAGTSMGSLVGALYAAGFTPRELAQLVASDWWWDVIARARPRVTSEAPALLGLELRGLWPVLPQGLFRAQGIAELLFSLTADACVAARGDFDSLRVPYRAVAVDLRTGQKVVLSHGDLATAIRASIAVPFLFPPVPLGQQLLVDGGVRDYLPVDVCKEMGAEVVVAIDAYGIEERAQTADNLFQVGKRVTDLWMQAPERSPAPQADLLVRVDLTGYSEMDYHKAPQIIAAGHRAMIACADSVRDMLARRLTSRRALHLRNGDERTRACFTWVKTTGSKWFTEAQLLAALGLTEVRQVSTDEIMRRVRRLYDSGVFGSVVPTVAFGRQGPGVEIQVRELLPTRLQLGFSCQDELGASGFARLVRWPALGRAMASAEVRAGGRKAEACLRLQSVQLPGSHVLPSLTVAARREWPWYYQSGRRVGSRYIHALGGEISVAKQLGSQAQVSIGAGVEEAVYQEGKWSKTHGRHWLVSIGFSGDSSQGYPLPVSGVQMKVTLTSSLRRFGGAGEFATVRAEGALLLPRGRHVFSPRFVLQAARGQVPPHRYVRFGGPDTLPGYHREELWSRQGLALALCDRFRLTKFLRMQFGVFANGSWGGQGEPSTRRPRSGTLLGLVAPTPFGPLSIAWGYGGRRDRNRLYLSLGYQL